ncbi:MAG: hypothetical protein ABI112_15355 [Terracoccus sp.]
MTDQTQKRLSAAYGRLILLMSLVWAATIMAAAVVDKASGEFVYLIFVLMGGFILSGAVLESGRRRMLDPAKS